MNQLPYTIKNLTLNLSYNKLGDNESSMKCLGDGLKQMKNLQYLNLDLERNLLCYNKDSMKDLGYGLKQLKNLI